MATSAYPRSPTFPSEIPHEYRVLVVWWEYTRRKPKYKAVFESLLGDAKRHVIALPRNSGVRATQFSQREERVLTGLGYASWVVVAPRVTADDFLAREGLPRFIYPDHDDGDPEAPIPLAELRSPRWYLPSIQAIRHYHGGDVTGPGYIPVGLRYDLTETELRAAVAKIYRELLKPIQRAYLGQPAIDSRPDVAIPGVLALAEVERATGPVHLLRTIPDGPTRARRIHEAATRAREAIHENTYLTGTEKARMNRFRNVLKRCDLFGIWPRYYEGGQLRTADDCRADDQYRDGNVTEETISRLIQRGRGPSHPVAPEK